MSIREIGILSRIGGISAPILVAPSVMSLAMTHEDVTLMLAVATSVVVVVIWLVRLEGRVNLAEQRHQDFSREIHGRLDRFGGVLERIDRKLDQVATRTFVANAIRCKDDGDERF